MFKIIDRPEFTHTVTVMVPVDGGHQEQSFKARFRVSDDEETDALDLNSGEGLKDFLQRTWVGMEDVIGEDDRPMTWNDQVRDALLTRPYIRLALLRTYMAAITKAKAGN